LKGTWFQPSEAYEVKTWFQSLLCNVTYLHRYTKGLMQAVAQLVSEG
jgi:hypothetical protein